MKVLLYLMTILLTICIWSCRSVQYVPVESVRYDSVYLSKQVTDSIYVKDSVLIVKGDTITEYRYRYIYQYKDRTDTIYVNRTDTIREPYPVEAKLTRWQQIKQDVGGISMFAFIIIIAIFVFRIIKRKEV